MSLNMYIYIFYIIVFLLTKVKSDVFSAGKWSDLKNNKIDVDTYCKSRNCIIKCCPENQIIVGSKCRKVTKQNIINLMKYSEIKVYDWNVSSSELVNTSEKFLEHFTFIHNDIFSNLSNSCPFKRELYVFKNGSIYMPSFMPMPFGKLTYCFDYYFKVKNKTLGLAIRTPLTDDTENVIKSYYVASGMLTSAVFMSFVVIVYGLLPQLRNIVGMSLMAYLVSLTCAYVLKAVQLIAVLKQVEDPYFCHKESAAIYYFIIASFLWLNVMSFDLWWTIRGTRKCRDIHRRGEMNKFMWYCLYAWGIPMVPTLIIVAVERYQLITDNAYKPPFENCFRDVPPTVIYLFVPIGIITIGNVLMFLLTSYNVWLVKRGVRDTGDSRTRNNEMRFIVYIKLFVLMGVSWLLELIPDLPLVPYIIVNSFNMFIGVTIFFIFVFKKSVIKMLCKRFNIQSSYIDRLTAINERSETTKSSRSSKSFKHKKEDHEETELTQLHTNTQSV